MQDRYEDVLEDNSVAMQLANKIIQFEIENNIEIEDEEDHSQGDFEYYEEFAEEASTPKKKRMENLFLLPLGRKDVSSPGMKACIKKSWRSLISFLRQV